MKKLAFLSAVLFSFSILMAQDKIIVNTDLGTTAINKNIYGHFAEHLGNGIYGGMYVGEGNTKIPNTAGVRNDIIEALKKLKIPLLRWPGGCFADTYHWQDGIGPKADRPSMLNVWWGGVTENNSFGTHDFLNMCKAIGADPYLAANVGSGTVQELADWVKYVNFPEGSGPMTQLRAKNGQKEPWNVNYWGVGNEAWGCGGNMKPEYYANIYKQYATFMASTKDRPTFKIASGANSEDYNWTEVLMRDIPLDMLDGLALHHYSVIDWTKKSSATAFTEDEYFTTLKRAWKMEELVTRHSTIMDKYDPKKKIALVVDEWGGWYDVEPGTNPSFLFQQNTMRDAMIAGLSLNIFNNHASRVRMANLAQTVNVLQAVILTNEEKMILTPTFHVMEMYNVHQDATLLPTDLNTGDYENGKDKIQAISTSASKDKNGKIHISVVNIDPNKKHEINLEMRGQKMGKVTGRILVSAKIQDHNSFESPNKIAPVVFKDFQTTNTGIKFTMPPASVLVIESIE